MIRRVAVAFAALLLVLASATCRPALPPPQLLPAPAPGSVVARVVLIGDAGAPHAGDEPVLLALRAALAGVGDRATTVFLGDNVYPKGLPAPDARDRPEMERRLRAQVDAALAGGGRAIFIPGNHDWVKGGNDGWAAVRRAAAFIAAAGDGRAEQVPADGCPGPARRDLPGDVRLLALDSQWWLHDGPKPGPGDGCAVPAHPDSALAALDRTLGEEGDALRLVVAHHPLASHGVHGGHFTLADHLFPLRELDEALWIPLPLIGSAYPIIRGGGISPQDLPNGRNQAWVQSVRAVLARHAPVLWANGHEHNLQVLTDTLVGTLLVSGSGIAGHHGPVGGAPDLRFGANASGFMVLDRLDDGRLRLGVWLVGKDGVGREVHAEEMAGRHAGGTAGG